MTFDESVREYQLRSSIGPLVQGMKLSPFVNVQQQEYDQVKFLNNLFYETINKLRKEYAPTVEMTQQQKDVFLLYKKMTWFDLFLSKLNEPDNRELSTLPNLSSFDNWGVSKERENELMQAWLHPETIKIVDE